MERKNRSAKLSLIFVLIFLGLLLALVPSAPALLRWYIGATHRPESMLLPILLTFYCATPLAVGTIVCLFGLLRSICKKQVFVSPNVRRLRLISWFVLIAAFLFLAAGFFYFPFFILAVCAAFVALIVRVVKNCFETAVLLKDENDLTI